MPDGPDAGPPVTDYPSALESTEHLRDGSEVRFRPIRRTDGEAMTAFHDTLSPRSVYRRFFSAHPHLSVGEVERFTHVDYVDRMAFVVTDDDRSSPWGGTSACRRPTRPRWPSSSPTTTSTGGSAPASSSTWPRPPVAHGIARFHAQTLSENRDMLGVFLSSGYPVTTTSEAGTVTVRFPIDPAGVTG